MPASRTSFLNVRPETQDIQFVNNAEAIMKEIEADTNTSTTPLSSSSQGPAGRPPVYNKIRGSKRAAMDIIGDAAKRRAALEEYRKDKRSAGDTSDFNLKTWIEYHDGWYRSEVGVVPPAFPLTAAHIEAVGSVLKGADYRSSYNYLNAAKTASPALGLRLV